MTGDFSRWRAANAKHQGYSAVLMQQGRLYTDSDWNENLAILNERAEDALAQVIGRSGTPADAPGFAITQSSGGFSIGAGSYWVDGVRIENPARISYAAQGGGGVAEALADSIADGAEMLVYLVVHKDEVSALDDPLLADPALAGADTAVREQPRWRVALRAISLTDAARDDLVAKARRGMAPDLPEWRPGTGRMRAGTTPPEELPDEGDCLLVPDAGYLAQENQLYRVQIVRGGSRAEACFVWSRENASVEARLLRNADGEFVLSGARADDALGFVSGGFVEIVDDRARALGRPGMFARITMADGVVSFVPGIGNFDQMVNPRVRRWDHAGTADGLPLTTAPTVLERGIEVAFSDGQYVVGDAWMFEARAATGAVIWPPFAGAADSLVPPMTWGRRYVPLALARRNGAGIRDVVDLRATFPALTNLRASDIGFDPGNCKIPADNVQQALEQLCQRSGGGNCTAVVRNADELIAAVKLLSAGQSIRLCLAGAAFRLPETLVFENLGHVVIEGTGPQTVLSVEKGEAALQFRGCASVQIRDLSVNGGPTGRGSAPHQGRLGALALRDCGDVLIERVRARCRAGLDRSASCISSTGARGRQQVVIRDCILKVGQAQIGIQIIGARRSIVENNQILAVPAPAGATHARIVTDRAQMVRLAASILRFAPASKNTLPTLSTLSSKTAFSTGPINQKGSISEAELDFAASAAETALYRGGMVSFRVLTPLQNAVSQVVQRSNAKARLTSAVELRRYMRNLLLDAIREPIGFTVVGRVVTPLPSENFATATTPFLAEGIVVAGDQLDEVRITGNRIEDANDGIRVAASGRQDPVLPRWRETPPANRIAHAVIEGNVITLNPLSNVSPAHGIYLGHVARAAVGRNSVQLDRSRLPRKSPPAPQYGIRQHGWRGPLLVMTENAVAGVDNGIAVVPGLDDRLQGIWRLRDNAVEQTRRAYVLGRGIEQS